MAKLTKADLEKPLPHPACGDCSYIKVGLSTCGIAAGAQEIFDLLSAEVAKRQLPVRVLRCGCSGQCYAEPLVEVCIDELPVVIYGRVDRDAAIRILEKHVRDKRLVNDHIVDIVTRRDA